MIKHFGENMSKFEESLNFNDIPLAGIISVINRSNHMYLSSMLKNSEITFGQYPFLMNLYHKDKQTQKELANTFKISEGTVARALKKLEDNNLITREENKNNRREKIITITKKGKELGQKFFYLDKKWEKEVLNSLDEEKQVEFKKIAHEIALKSSEIQHEKP